MNNIDAHKADKGILWVVYSNQMPPTITATLPRYLYGSSILARQWTNLVSDNKNKWHYMKLSAGQSKVIKALYKQEKI